MRKLCTMLAIAAGACGIAAPSALANHVKAPPGVQVQCPATAGGPVQVSLTYEAWSNANNPVTEKFSINGGAQITQTYNVPGNGATHSFTVAAAASATYSIAFTATWPGGNYTGNASVTGCSVPKPPSPPVTPQPPYTPPPAPTCASNPTAPGATQGMYPACKTPQQVCTDAGMTGTYTGGPLGTEGCVTPQPPVVVTPTPPVTATPVVAKPHKPHTTHPKKKHPKKHAPKKPKKHPGFTGLRVSA